MAGFHKNHKMKDFTFSKVGKNYWRWGIKVSLLGNLLNPSSFFGIVAKLSSANVGAHLITAACLPFVTRLYSPDQFGAFAIFVSAVSILSVATCGRFDVAIALPEDDDDASGLCLLAVFVAFGFFVLSSFALLGVAIFRPDLLAGGRAWIYYVPLAVLFAGWFSTLLNWEVRQKKFGTISVAALTQSVTMNAVQLVAGTVGVGFLGLALGHAAKFAAAVMVFSTSMAREVVVWATGNYDQLSTILPRLVKTYRRFPIYSTWEALANQAAIFLPIMLISRYTPASDVGNLMLAMSLMQAPVAVIGTSISQVFLSEAPNAHRRGELALYTKEIFFRLLKITVLPFLGLALVAPFGMTLAFGAGWERAGWLIVWMVPWFLLQSAVSPVSMALHVMGRAKTSTALQISALFVRLIAVWVGYKTAPYAVLEFYAVSGAVVYAGYLIVLYFVLNTNWGRGSRQENAN